MIDAAALQRQFVRHRARGRFRREREVVTAVDGVDLTVMRGEMVGYLGPNGAGKSTTIKMLTGILVPTAGRLRVLGLEPHARRVELARRIGVVFGQRSQLWWDLPLRDSFELVRHVYRLDPATHRASLDDLVARFDLGAFLDAPVRQLSLGQRMRGELAVALLHRPELVVLDEPTIGLDVVSKHAVREALAALNRDDGVTVLLTTHDLGDVEHLCDRLVVVDDGRIVADCTLEELRARFGDERLVTVELETASPPLRLDGVTTVRVEGPRQWLRFSAAERSAAVVLASIGAAASVRDVTITPVDITDLIRRIYERGSEP